MTEGSSKKHKAKDSSPSFKEVYALKEPHVHAALSAEAHGVKYVVIEPTLMEEEKKAGEKIKEILFQVLDVDARALGSRENAEEWLQDYITKIVKGYRIKVAEGSLDKIIYYLVRDLIHFAIKNCESLI